MKPSTVGKQVRKGHPVGRVHSEISGAVQQQVGDNTDIGLLHIIRNEVREQAAERLR